MGSKYFIFAVMYLGAVLTSYGAQDQTLFSPATSGLFSQFGNSLLDESPNQAKAAMTFLQAGILLDEQSVLPYEQFLRGAGKTCPGWQDYSDTILLSLRKYLDRNADLGVAVGGLGCVIENTNTRIQRELLLEKLMGHIAGLNSAFSSDVATQLGLYAVEKADYSAAVGKFDYAWGLNPYNLLAYTKLTEIRTRQEKAGFLHDQLMYCRLRLAVNPADLEAAVEFGRNAYEAELYTLASDAFEYAASLYAWLNPDWPIHEDIYIGWAQSCYFVASRQIQCITLANQLRASGKLNLAMESVAALAARELGKNELSDRILSEAASKAEQQIITGLPGITAAELGWFYCFVVQDAEKAAGWCNRAYSEQSEDPHIKSLMAYALYMHNQDELAAQYSMAVDPNIPAAAMTLASIDIRNDQKQKASRRLISLLDGYVPLAVYYRAVSLLKQCGIDYSRNFPVETIRESLAGQFGAKIIPAFARPEKMFSARLNFNGSEFPYGGTIESQLVINNTGSIPLIIDRNGLLTGRYQVDAVISGDLNGSIPALLEGEFRPARPLLPGEAMSLRMNVDTGKLKKMLFACPQASLEIKFKVYLNPVNTGDQIVCAIPGVNPVEATIRRKGISLSSEYLVGRLDALNKGQEGLKIRSAELFAGLYAEQLAHQAGTIRYRHTQADAALLKDAVRQAVGDENWKVGVHMLILLSEHSIPLDYAMTLTISELLDHEQWPMRMAAMWLLASQQKSSFQSVLDWKAQYDPFWLNRQMAINLGGVVKKALPAEPDLKTPKSDANEVVLTEISSTEKKI